VETEHDDLYAQPAAEANSAPDVQPPSQSPPNLAEGHDSIPPATEQPDIPPPPPESPLEEVLASDDHPLVQTEPQASSPDEQDEGGHAPEVAEHNDVPRSLPAPEETPADQSHQTLNDTAAPHAGATMPIPQALAPPEESNDDAPLAEEIKDDQPLSPADNSASEAPAKTGKRPVVQRVLQMRSVIPKLPSPKRFSFKKKESK